MSKEEAKSSARPTGFAPKKGASIFDWIEFITLWTANGIGSKSKKKSDKNGFLVFLDQENAPSDGPVSAQQ